MRSIIGGLSVEDLIANRNLTVLNGAQGIGEIMNQVIGQAGPALDLARQALGSNGARNGHAEPARSEAASGN